MNTSKSSHKTSPNRFFSSFLEILLKELLEEIPDADGTSGKKSDGTLERTSKKHSWRLHCMGIFEVLVKEQFEKLPDKLVVQFCVDFFFQELLAISFR